MILLRRTVDDPSAQVRPGQRKAIQALVEGRERLLVVERTGWGKSIVYFIASRPVRYVVATQVHPLFNGAERGAGELQTEPRS